MRVKLILAISSVMLVATILIFGMKISSLEDINLKVKSGVGEVTLSDLDKIIELNGEWEFYPNKLLTPSEISNSDISPTFINVPQVWGDYVDSTNELEVGTYRVYLKVPKEEDYALRINSIHYGNKVYINGKEAGGVGNPSTNASNYSFIGKKFNAYGKSINGEIEIVIQVANHLDFSGGIVNPVLFGTAEKIDNFTIRSIIVDSIIVAGTFLIGLLFLIKSGLKRRLGGDLFFTLYCFAQGIYFSTQNEKVILIYATEIANYTLWKWQLVPLNMAVILLILFSNTIFKDYVNKKLMISLIIINFFTALIITFDNPIIGLLYDIKPQAILVILVVSALLGFIFVFLTFIKGVFHKKGEVSELIISITAFICYGLSVGFKNIFEVNMGYWPTIMQVILILSIAYSISYREELKNRKINNLSNEIIAQQKLKDALILKISEGMKKPIINLAESAKSLMDGKVGPLKPKQQEAVNAINLSVTKLQRLMTDLINGIQFNGQIHLTAQGTILKMLNELIHEISFFIKDSNKVQIKTNFSEKIPIIYADVKLLKQAIFNILHNAVKYTESGEITISTFEKTTLRLKILE